MRVRRPRSRLRSTFLGWIRTGSFSPTGVVKVPHRLTLFWRLIPKCLQLPVVVVGVSLSCCAPLCINYWVGRLSWFFVIALWCSVWCVQCVCTPPSPSPIDQGWCYLSELRRNLALCLHFAASSDRLLRYVMSSRCLMMCSFSVRQRWQALPPFL